MERTRKIKLGAEARLPFSLFTPQSAEMLKERLTFRVRSFLPHVPDKEVLTYRLDREAGEVVVPLDMGLQLLQSFPGVASEDYTSAGMAEVFSRLPDPDHPSAP